MHPTETFQLAIQFVPQAGVARESIKDDVKNWLLGVGEESFVEGALDDLYLDPDYEEGPQEQYRELGGDMQPLSIYKYDREHLVALKEQLEASFGSRIACELGSMQTEMWMEGWKESFKPIRTQRFYIYPPWLAHDVPSDRIPLVIEPGMAFGTGQHATTVLCMEAIEDLDGLVTERSTVLDVGTGTGILAIAASKLGFTDVMGTDIDPDAILASADNARANEVALVLEQGSIPEALPAQQVVIANIIFYVLRKIIGDLAGKTAAGGYLVLSGLLAEEARDMQALAEPFGLQLEREQVRDDWACQIYRKA
jgi:ribosomal protein L11 methyltransferase